MNGIHKSLIEKEGKFQKLQWDNEKVTCMKKECERTLKSFECERDKMEAKADVLKKERDRVVNVRQKDLDVIRQHKDDAISRLKLSHGLELQNRDKIIDDLNIENIKVANELKRNLRAKEGNEESFRILNEHIETERLEVKKRIDDLEMKLSHEKSKMRTEVQNKNDIVKEKNAVAQHKIVIEELLQKAKIDIEFYKKEDIKRVAEYFTLETELQERLHDTSQKLNQALFKFQDEKKRFERGKLSVEAELVLCRERSDFRIEELEKAVSTLSNARNKEKDSFDSTLSILTSKIKEQNEFYEENVFKEQELCKFERRENIELKKEAQQVATEKLELSVALDNEIRKIYELENDVRCKEKKILVLGERIKDLLSTQDDCIIRERNIKREVQQLRFEVRRD